MQYLANASWFKATHENLETFCAVFLMSSFTDFTHPLYRLDPFGMIA
jgi:hypothetical protein